jgi:DNA polymerase-1
MIRKLLSEEKPEYFAVAFDSKEKTFRHDAFLEYKSNARGSSTPIPYIRRICVALGLPVLESRL